MNDERLVTYDTAVAELPELPEAWRRSVYQSAAQSGLTETDPLWWFLVEQARMLQQFLDALPNAKASGNGNGVSPGQLKSTQLEAITVSLKALPRRDDVPSKKDLQRIEQQLDQAVQAIQKIEKARDRQSPGQGQAEHWASRWAKIVGVGFILFGLGYLLCWAQLHTEGDARVDRIINTQKTEYRVPLWLISHQGSISLGPLKPSEGHNETQGVIIYPGDLKLAQPWVSTDGATVVPIK